MQSSTRPIALFGLSFRPFFLAGAVYALFAIPLWIAAFLGYVPDLQPSGGWLAWHRHEMLFGFSVAIVAGFLLTAVQSWTGVPGLSGAPLILLSILWLAARLAWLADAPMWLLMPVELAFLPAVAVAFGWNLWQVRQYRNVPILVVLGLLALCNLYAMIGLQTGDHMLQRRGAFGALWLVAALMSVIGGRVIPFFTQRGLNLPAPSPALPWLDNLLLIGSILIAALMLSGWGLAVHGWQAPLYLLVATGQIVRLVRWYRPGIWKVPLLWSLHVAYAWMAVALLAMALWHAGWEIGLSQATHLLAIGGMTGLILAMLARVTLGHTGRPLQPPGYMNLAFILISLAVPARVWLIELSALAGFWLAVVCWSIAFAMYLWHYAPLLCKPRPDGRPG